VHIPEMDDARRRVEVQMAAKTKRRATRTQQRTKLMSEEVTIAPNKPKSKPAVGFAAIPEASKFEIPRFELPKFEIPKMEVPAAFRELAEKSVSQAKDSWEKMKAATEETTDLIEDSYSTASKGCADYGLKLIEVSRANTNAAFDLASELLTVKSLSEAVELSTAHLRKQFDAMSAQTKELTALAQKVATEASEPLKASVTGAFKKVA
jgi:phasin